LTPSAASITNPIFKWYTSADRTGPITSGSGGVLTLTNLAAGTHNYYVSVTGDGKCENTPNTLKQVTIVVKPLAVAADISVSGSPSGSICPGSNVVLTPLAAGVTNPVYTWYTGSDRTGLISSGVSAGVLTLSNLTDGTYNYYVSVSGDEKCENAANTLKQVQVTIAYKPLAVAADISVSGGPSGSVCPGTGAILTPSAAGITNPVYTWYTAPDRTGLISSGVSAGVLTLENLTAGTHNYYVSVSGNEKCENAANTLQQVTIVVSPQPAQPSLITGSATLCAGSTGVVYSVTDDPSVTYSWTYTQGSGSTIASGQGTRAITVDYSNTATSGTWIVTATDKITGCTSIARSLVVTVNPLPTASITYS
jgi:hypothetical protein